MADPIETAADNLTRKVGPLPAWAWAGITVAGVTTVILIRRRYLAAGGANGAEPEGDSGEGGTFDEMYGAPSLPGGFVIGGGVPGTGSDVTGDDPTTPETPEPPATNADWQREAVRYLTARGVQPTLALDSVSRFLAGRTLTSQGQAIIDMALRGVGAPPQPVPPATVSPTPEPVPSPGGGGTTPKPKPKPAPVKTVDKPATVTKPAVRTSTPKPPPAPKPDPVRTTVTLSYGDTLYALYRRVYGHYPSVAQVRAVAAFNGLSVGPAPNYNISPWRVGQAVKFPTQEP